MEGKFVFRRINFPRLCAKATTRRPSIICNSLYANRGQMHSDTPTRGCTACTKCVSRQIITCPEQNQGFIREKMYTPGTGMVIYLICIFHSLTGYHSRHSPLPPSPFAVASLPLLLPAPAIASMARTQLPCSTVSLMGKPSTWGRRRRGGSRD